MKLLLSLYACEPNRGSEPGVGWAWALGMAKRHTTYVLTRKTNQATIEAELARLNLPPDQTPIFLYHDLSPLLRKLKHIHVFPTSLYYFFWQLTAPSFFDQQHISVDIIHHITWCSYSLPGCWYNRSEKVVLGPMGGYFSCPPQFLRLFSGIPRIREFLRTLSRKIIPLSFTKALANANATLFVSKDMADRYKGTSEMDIGVPKELLSTSYDSIPIRLPQFVWAGELKPYKAFEIAARAFAQACQSGLPESIQFHIFGAGPEEDKYRSLIQSLHMENRILLLGKVSQTTLWEEMRKSLALVFSSVRDTCGSVNIEAMALQCPILCFNHQGVGEITNDTCAIRIPPTSWEDSIQAFANAMLKLGNNPSLVEQMGHAARQHALAHYTWETKFDTIETLYQSLLSKP